MQALLYGVRPEEWVPPDPSNRLQAGLARVPMRLVDREEPQPQRSDWVDGQDPPHGHLRLGRQTGLQRLRREPR